MLSLSFPANVLKAVVHFLYSDEVKAIKGMVCIHTPATSYVHICYTLKHVYTHSHTQKYVVIFVLSS